MQRKRLHPSRDYEGANSLPEDGSILLLVLLNGFSDMLGKGPFFWAFLSSFGLLYVGC